MRERAQTSAQSDEYESRRDERDNRHVPTTIGGRGSSLSFDSRLKTTRSIVTGRDAMIECSRVAPPSPISSPASHNHNAAADPKTDRSRLPWTVVGGRDAQQRREHSAQCQ